MTALLNGWSRACSVPTGGERLRKENGWLLKKLSPKPLDAFKAGASSAMLIVIFPAICLFMGMYGMHSGRLPGGRAIALSVGGVLFLVLGIASAPAILGNTVRRYKKQSERLAKLSKTELADLEKEMETAECRFGTFYLLEDYLCVPGAGLLLPYRSIKSVRAMPAYGKLRHVHRACVTERDSFIWMVHVRDWHAFLKEYEDFCAELNRRKQEDLLRRIISMKNNQEGYL